MALALLDTNGRVPLEMKISQHDLILACLAAADGNTYDPAQIQKLVFLFSRKGNDREKAFSFLAL